MTEPTHSLRPDSVTWFARLNYASLILGYGSAMAVMPPEQPGVFHGSGGHKFGLALMTILLAVLVWLAANRRRNFARLILITCAVLFLPLGLPGLPDILQSNPMIGIAGLVAFVAQAAAAALLCTSSAMAWFKAGTMQL